MQRRLRSHQRLLLAVAVIIVAVGSLIAARLYDGKPPAAPEPLNFALRDFKGRPVQLSQLRGQVVAVNFWATWCGPCRMEIPGFLKVYNRYREKGLEIVGVSLDQTGASVVEAFVKRYKIRYPVVMATPEVIEYYKKYSPLNGIPTTFFIDRQGRIAKQHVGYMNETLFETTIKPLVQSGL